MDLTYRVMRVIRAHDGLLASLIVGAALASLGSTAEAGSNRILKGSGGPAGSVTGIDFNRFVADGKLYGVSTVDGKIFVLDAATGDTVYVAGPAGLVIGPDDLAVGSDGYVYYTDTLGGFVGRLDPATDATVRLASLPLVNSIRFSTDGTRLFAGQCFLQPPFTNGLYEIDFQHPGAAPQLITDSFGLFCSLNSFDYHDDHIYGPQVITGQIFRVDPNTGTKDIVVNSGTLINPSAVEFDSQGRLWVIDSAVNKLYRVDHPELNGQIPVLVSTLPGGSGVDNIAIDQTNGDRIHVSSGADGYIIMIDPNTGGVIDYLKTGGPVLPTGIAITSDGKTFLGDYLSLRTVNVPNHKIVASTTNHIDLAGQSIIRPLMVAPFGTNVIVTDWFARRIQLWDPTNGVPLALIAPAPGNTPLNAIAYQGGILSAEFNTSPFLTSTLVANTGPGFQTKTTLLPSLPFAAVTGLATNGTDVWFADWVSGTIRRFDGATTTVVAFGLSQPEGIALDTDGQHLLVMEVGARRLVSVDLLGTPGANVATVEDNLDVGYTNGFAPSFGFLSGVAVDPTNNDILYVADAKRELRVLKR